MLRRAGWERQKIYTADYSIFTRLLRRTRKQAGLTQEQLAKKLDTTQSFISKCERGERRLDILELRAFCLAMNTTVLHFAERLEKAISESTNQPT